MVLAPQLKAYKIPGNVNMWTNEITLTINNRPSVPLSTEEKKMLAAERKQRYQAGMSASQKEEQLERDRAQKERNR